MKKVMVFGVFDFLHEGHINFFQQAKKFGDLIISVARDVNVEKIKDQKPFYNEKKRVQQIKKLKIASKVILGGIKNPWPHIKKINPDIIALGYDQKDYVGNLKKELESRGFKIKVIRLRPFKSKIFKSSIIRKKKL